jgi:hypothetical protein
MSTLTSSVGIATIISKSMGVVDLVILDFGISGVGAVEIVMDSESKFVKS